MNLPEKPPTHPDVQTLSLYQTKPTAKWGFAKGILRLVSLAVIAGAVLCPPIGSPVLAKNGHQANTKDPAIDPDAMAALDKMGAYLRTVKAFQVTADVTTDNVLDDGQTIQESKKVNIVAERPSHFRIEVNGDDGHRFLFFDGKNFTIYAQIANFYATVPAPPTLAELTDHLINKYGIDLPLVELFEWGTNDADIKKITAAMDIGPSTVEGVTCEQYAFRQEGVDWQIWIQLGNFPLPRKLAIRTLTDEAKPQHTEVMVWNLAPSFSEDAFTFDPPTGVLRIPIAEVKAQADKKNK